jgi:hypothetical protein
MSASTEKLLEEIKLAEDALLTAERSGDTVGASGAKLALQVLRKHFNKANEALTEGKQILKG